MVLVLINKNGKTELIMNVEIKGNAEDPWDPIRAHIKFENLSDYEIKVFSISGKLEEVPLEDGTLLIYPRPTLPPPPPKTLPVKAKVRVPPTHIAYVSTVRERCGVATYTRFLSREVGKFFPVKIHRRLDSVPQDALIHLQHEFGLFPDRADIVGRQLESSYSCITWHTVMREPVGVMLRQYHEADRNYDAHIVHNDLAKKYLSAYTRRPIYVIPHGSLLWEPTPKETAREILGLPSDKKIVFCFGFAAETKGFEEVARAASKLKNALFIISAAIHDLLREHGLRVVERVKAVGSENVKVLGRYLSEGEINLYASAADVLLFNYKTPRFVSSASGALHRVLAAGKPIVCTFDNRMIDLEDGVHALKYRQGDVEGMIHCLNLVFEDRDLAERLGENARKLAERTSWRNVAKMHIKVYNEIAGDAIRIGGFNGDYYDEKYFADVRGRRFNTGETVETWGYKNPSGDWAGCADIIKAWKRIFNPRNMLDVGCGRGTFVAYAREAGIEAYGFDFSRWAVNEGRFYRCKAEWLRLHDATKPWPYPDRYFDLVTAIDFYEHIYAEDLDFVVDEMLRVARKWVFLQIATTKKGEEGYILRKGEPVSFRERRTWAGHVTVCDEEWWRKRLRRRGWRFRDDLVEEFVKLVPKPVIRNWLLNTMLVMERVGDGEG